MKVTITLDEPYELEVEVNQYLAGGTALLLTELNGLPFTTVSVHLPETATLPEGVFFVKHWSENAPIVQQLIEQNIIEVVPEIAPAVSGFVSNIKAYKLKD